ncbi:MAG: glutathione S-transferase family protein [Bdellovibrionaceae bacterium]|nr:glutathione S-transferase family protein [Pseudobdellovibrionaceae bacterium]
MITLYGSPRTSAGRCVWALEEAGVAYNIKELDMRAKEHKSAEYLKINPNGKVPAMIDGDLTLFESMAINFYIAEAYKKDLLGSNLQERGLVHQWSFWAIAELQAPLIEVFIQKVFTPEEKQDAKVIELNLNELPNLFNILNSALNERKYLVGNQFTLADLNTASVASISKAIGFDLAPYSNMTSWMKVISERPAYQKYMTLRAPQR